jgi:aarF domain-containing kinase
VVSEIRGRFATEFDFQREAASLTAVGASMRARFHGQIVVPRPRGELSTARMLVMEYVPGPTLAKQLERDTLRAVGGRNFARLAARARGDDVGAAALPAASAGDQLRLALAVPSLWRLRRAVAAQLALLARAHGAQIFLDGKFNGDPHGGNVLVVPGRGRALGLIDFGQVRDMSVAQRRDLGRLVLALADRRASDGRIAGLFRELGFRSKLGSEELAARIARIMFDADDHSDSPAAVLRSLAALDSIEQFPLEFVMAARVSLILRGLGLAVGVRVRTAELWKPYALECLREHAEPPRRALITF